MVELSELDYRIDAQKKQQRLWREAQRADRYVKIMGIKNEKAINELNKKTVLKYLIKALDSATLEERRSIWSETKFLANNFRVDIRFSLLRKMFKMWSNKRRVQAAA